MEELLELRRYIEQQRYTEALDLLAEMEEMSREDKLPWELSIRHAARHIARVNTRYKARGTYLGASELREILTEAYQPALERAALEAFEGRYDDVELGQKVDRATIEQKALELLIAYQEGQYR